MSPVAELYPEIVAHGTFAQAIVAVAAGRGVDLGDVSTPAGYAPADAWQFADIRCGEQQMSAYLSDDEHRFRIIVTRSPQVWAAGLADSLDAVVDVAVAWCAGMRLRDAVRRFPFLATTGLELAFEAGTHVEYRWSVFLGNTDEYPNMQPLLRAVHADDRLRTLFPSVSHDEELRLDAPVGQLRFELLPSGQFRVSVGADEPAGTYDVDGAVRWAAELAAP